MNTDNNDANVIVPAAAFSTKPTVDDTEYAAAEKAALNAMSAYTHKLAKPFTYEGQTFTELSFDFGRLTGDDALAIEDELQMVGKPTISPTFSGQFLIRMAARACTTTFIGEGGQTRRIGSDLLRALPISEFNRIRSKARSFLLASEL